MIPDFYQRYLDKAGDLDLIKSLIMEGDEMGVFYRSIPPSKYDFRYESTKWSIKELLGHMIDAERIFGFRALCFVRENDANLPGYEQDDYITRMNIENRQYHNVVNEFINLRNSTIDLFSSFSSEQRHKKGIASGYEFTVEQVGKLIVGHEIWHREIIKEKYL